MTIMVQALHFDGLILLFAALALAVLGQTYHRWAIRVPLFVLATCNFALAIELFGLYRPAIAPTWFWLRMGADVSTLVIVGIHFWARRPHMHLAVPHHHHHHQQHKKVAGQR